MRVVLAIGLAGCGFAPLAATSTSDATGDGHGSDAATCNPACALGCDATATRCLELVPSNGIDPAWLGLGSAFAPTADVAIDTDLGTIDGVAGAYHQVAAIDCGGGNLVGIGVFSFTSIAIPPAVTVRATGMRALALVAAGTIEIDGVIDLGGGDGCADPPRCGGAGGWAGGLYDAFDPQIGYGPGGGGHGYSDDGPGNESGGGGGGACGTGGSGGDDGSGLYPAGLGGTPYLATNLAPLCGGSGGGAGGPASYTGDPGSRGGGGGGALQLVSATSVTIAGGITVAGAGGQGDKAPTYDDGGGGGGAGGAILIEAPAVTIATPGVVAANGGGGGGGYNNGAISTDGDRGTLSATPAAGGPGVRRGGNGAAGATTTGESAPGPVGDGGAGGGGGIGRIRLHTRTGAASLAGVVSPSGSCTSQGTVTTR